ncbi:hypothetical protein GE21DRAFT_1313943 [Neurospora crassa]|nr:hypothetical protein GE21DRAFT_1313943 [Neurospora crassa]
MFGTLGIDQEWIKGLIPGKAVAASPTKKLGAALCSKPSTESSELMKSLTEIDSWFRRRRPRAEIDQFMQREAALKVRCNPGWSKAMPLKARTRRWAVEAEYLKNVQLDPIQESRGELTYKYQAVNLREHHPSMVLPRLSLNGHLLYITPVLPTFQATSEESGED